MFWTEVSRSFRPEAFSWLSSSSSLATSSTSPNNEERPYCQLESMTDRWSFCWLGKPSVTASTSKQIGYIVPSAACLKARQVEKAAYEGLATCLNCDWNKDLGMVDPGRRADGAELAMERETVRGTERAKVRRVSIFKEYVKIIKEFVLEGKKRVSGCRVEDGCGKNMMLTSAKN